MSNVNEIITSEEREYLLDSMANLLSEYSYRYTESALNKIIDTWAEQKADLIAAFKKHPNYLPGKFMIAFSHDYERKLDPKETHNFINWFCNRDKLMELRALLPAEMIAEADEEEARVPRKIYNFIKVDLPDMVEAFISKETETHINGLFPDAHAHAGQKTSRIMNKVFKLCYIDKLTDYNKVFAKYADSLTPMVITRHTVLSINPLDYFTMSFGNSWASCHTIDKNNKRNMPNSYEGMYSSGTMSYMLDKSSMVFYTVDGGYNGTELWNEPKITRQMFHWGENKLVQGRLYPQGNDGDGSVYTPNRTIVQEIMASIMEVPNLWTLKRGTSAACDYIYSIGTHYRDYANFSDCTLSILKDSDNPNNFTVGHRPICIECGGEHNNAESINCCHTNGSYWVCAACGEEVYDSDEIHYINGEYYCEDCCSYCVECDEWHTGDHTYIDGYGDVCESCLEDNFTYCDECDEYYRNRDITYVGSTDRNVCNGCLDEFYFRCPDCNEYIHNNDAEYFEDDMLCESCAESRNLAAVEQYDNEDEEAC